MCTETAGMVVALRETAGLVTVEVAFPSGLRRSCLAYVDGVELGAHVLVAGGAVVDLITAEEAEERATLADRKSVV